MVLLQVVIQALLQVTESSPWDFERWGLFGLAIFAFGLLTSIPIRRVLDPVRKNMPLISFHYFAYCCYLPLVIARIGTASLSVFIFQGLNYSAVIYDVYNLLLTTIFFFGMMIGYYWFRKGKTIKWTILTE